MELQLLFSGIFGDQLDLPPVDYFSQNKGTVNMDMVKHEYPFSSDVWLKNPPKYLRLDNENFKFSGENILF